MSAPSNQSGGGGVMDVPMLNLAMLPRLKVPQGCHDVLLTGNSDKSTGTTVEGNGVNMNTALNFKEESGKHVSLSARVRMAQHVSQQADVEHQGQSESKGVSPGRHMLPSTFTALTIASPEKSLEDAASPDGGRTPRVFRMKPSMHSPLRMVGKASPCSVRIQSSSRLEGPTITKIQNVIDHDHMMSRTQQRRDEMMIKEEEKGWHAKDNAEQQLGGQKGCGMPPHVARMLGGEGNNSQFRELSFGNLLDREAVTDMHNHGGRNNASPKPIGLFPSPVRKHSPIRNKSISSSPRPGKISNGSKAHSVSQRHNVDFASQELKSPRKRSRKSSAPMRAAADAY
eukprot:jgi/Picsp_1/5614/NSC_02973-R1_---NA---